MSFLQPWMLLGLPLIALPIIIHLINQRRYQTVPWAAMVFLLTANKMSSGYAKIRRYLILAARTLAVAGLIFAVARPLSSGWLGLAVGSQVDTTIVLIDRSPSMAESGPAGQTKLQSLVSRLIDSLGVVRSNRYVWIDDDSGQPVELDSPEQLRQLNVTQPSAATADVPTMLETASTYLRENRPSSAEVWIVSDLRQGDWNVASGRWKAINRSLRELTQSVRLHLLTASESSSRNRSIRVTSAKRSDGRAASARVPASEAPAEPNASAVGSELLLSLVLRQTDELDSTEYPDGKIPIELDLGGARSEFFIKPTGDVTELANLSIPLDGGSQTGWGRVSLPADVNTADNDFYFAYGEPTIRRTVVVCEDAIEGETDEAKPLMLAAGIAPDPEVRCEAIAVASDEFASVELDEVALVLWTESLPDEAAAAQLQPFLRRGGRLMFFAPESIQDRSYAGVSWGDWVSSQPPAQVSTWIGDHDLLSSVRSGASLPVGELKVQRYRKLEGPRLTLAYLTDEDPLLARAVQDSRGVYFIATDVAAQSSTLARGGVVLYAMIQRSLAEGADTLGATRQLIAGQSTVSSDNWKRLTGAPVGTSSHFTRYSGIYADEDRLIAVNRGEWEDSSDIVDRDQLEGLFAGLEFDRVDADVSDSNSLVQEVWRLFLILMLIALLAEALLCLPKRRDPVNPTSGSSFPGTLAGS